MIEGFNWRLSGDDSVQITGTDIPKLRILGRSLRQDGNWLEVVDGISDLTILFDPLILSPLEALSLIERLETLEDGGQTHDQQITLAVTFGGKDGPDLDDVCSALNVTEEQLIEDLTSADLFVDLMGFTPGFAYVGGVPQHLNVPRLKEPRKLVPAGSLGLAAGKCGTYSLDGPGGWPLIGRINTPLFDPISDEPFRLRPGMRIRLVNEIIS